MQPVTILLLGISAGIAGYAGVSHLLIGAARRPRDATHLLFGLVCLAVAAHTLVVLALHTASTVAQYVVVLKYAFGPTTLVTIVTLLWFVACYTGQRPRRFLLAMSLWFVLVVVLHFYLPFGIMYADISGLRSIRLPWGEQIVIARGPPHPLQLFYQPFYLTMFAFFGYALVRQHRAGRRRRALVLGLALALFLAARVIDPLVVLGVIEAPLTSQCAFLGIVIAMSLVLSHGVTQTEIELYIHQQHLHGLVAARTAALRRANAQLTALKQLADIGIRMNDLPSALQAMSEVATSLFDARSTVLLLPPIQAGELPLLVGYARGAGALGPTPLDVAFADLPLTTQVLAHGQSLLIPALHVHLLPPALRAFVNAHQLHSMMLIPLAIPGTVIGVLVVATDQHERTFTSDEVRLAETIAGDMSAAIDHTRLFQRAVTARERLATLYQASQIISQTSLDPEQIYAELHAAIARLMPTEAFVITLFDEANQTAEDVYLADNDGRRPGGRYSLARSFAGYLLGRDASVRIDDVRAFPQTEFAFARFCDGSESASGVAALLRGSERVLGLVFVGSDAQGAYRDEDEEGLTLLAAHAAAALENAWRYHHARALATSAERTRLAHDLHDAVTQTLYSASLLAEALPTIWRRNASEGERDVAILRQLVRGAMAEMRTLLFELRPTALVSAELSTLLRQLGDALTGNSRIPVEVTVEGAEPVPADLKIAVYRIAQEAFHNIAKHASATRVWVTFRSEPGALLLAVRDDGCGFDPAAIPDDHMGVRIMAERAAGIGARLGIDSAPWHGTTVSVRWPDR